MGDVISPDTSKASLVSGEAFACMRHVQREMLYCNVLVSLPPEARGVYLRDEPRWREADLLHHMVYANNIVATSCCTRHTDAPLS